VIAHRAWRKAHSVERNDFRTRFYDFRKEVKKDKEHQKKHKRCPFLLDFF